MAEMARVASRHLLVSVPREPLWRGLNMARGAYWRSLGNTPGHVNHWSKRGFVSLLSRYGTVEEARSPFPWTMLLVRALSRPSLRPRRGDPVGGDRRHRADHVRLLLAREPRAARGRVRPDHAAVVGGLHHRVGALPAGGAAAVAHDRRPRRARRAGHRAPAGGGDDPARARRCCSWSWRSRCGGRSRTTCSAARRRSTGSWSSRCWPTRPATSRAATSPGHRLFPLYGGLVLMEATSRCLFALAVAVGIAEGQTAVALGMAAAPIVSLAVVPPALARRLDRQRSRWTRMRRSGAARRCRARRAGRARARVHAGARDRLRRRGARRDALRADVPERRPAAREGHRRLGRRGARRLRVQRAPDRARPAPALPGGADLDPPPPHPRRGPAASATRSRAA